VRWIVSRRSTCATRSTARRRCKDYSMHRKPRHSDGCGGRPLLDRHRRRLPLREDRPTDCHREAPQPIPARRRARTLRLHRMWAERVLAEAADRRLRDRQAEFTAAGRSTGSGHCGVGRADYLSPERLLGSPGAGARGDGRVVALIVPDAAVPVAPAGMAGAFFFAGGSPPRKTVLPWGLT